MKEKQQYTNSLCVLFPLIVFISCPEYFTFSFVSLVALGSFFFPEKQIAWINKPV